MKTALTILCLLAFTLSPTVSRAAEPPAPLVEDGPWDDAPRDELSPAQEQAMWEEINRNVTPLREAGLLAAPDTTQAVTYNFPLRMAPGLTDYAGFRVSAFVDHNPSSGVNQILDYNGGTRTYDGHRGTDYALYPFSWNKLDAGEVQVIAAAAGTIINKVDGDPTDHNPCDGGSSADNWNYIALLHTDGRLTIYGHMRHGSLTNKAVGQAVAQGEYLGTVASSGNSSGPHLHFEVRYGGFSSSEWVDPYTNNPATSLWAGQRPYYDSAINKLATHSAPPVTPDACSLTTTNLQDNFLLPATIYFYAYYRDFQGALPTQFTIYRPDGSTYDSWQYTSATIFSSAWNTATVKSLSVSEPSGTWRLAATYNSQNYETFFTVGTPTIILSSPNGSEQWDILFSHPITWTDNFANDVSISLYHSGTLSSTITAATPSDGLYDWVPGLAFPPGPGYTIRVTNVLSNALFDESDAPFTLLPTTLTNRLYLPTILR